MQYPQLASKDSNVSTLTSPRSLPPSALPKQPIHPPSRTRRAYIFRITHNLRLSAFPVA
jgi:hypothetical protein